MNFSVCESPTIVYQIYTSVVFKHFFLWGVGEGPWLSPHSLYNSGQVKKHPASGKDDLIWHHPPRSLL